MLQKIGVEAISEPAITRGGIKEVIHTYDGLIIRSKTFVDEDLLANAQNLKFVARAGSGIDNLDADYLKSKSIHIINTPEGNRDAVGEHTIGLILNLLHNLQQGHQQVIQHIWDREGNRGAELSNKTVGIIGYGHMGSSLAKKLQSFGCKVIAYDKYHPNFRTDYAQSVALNQLKEESDILSLHIPLTSDTLNMTSDHFFNAFKKSLIFINTSRGEVAPLGSIVDALKSGKISKAGLDVLENEKLNTLSDSQQKDFDYLVESGKVIFTPHVAGWSTESYIRINKVLVKKIKSLF
ncbi:MAG: NAD(P)-binding domain-containing protein [Cyclobacteriaceae bacterium]|nr:NAD(P)-binding domain-containing protein [Cyclobacteriaceae bacterium]